MGREERGPLGGTAALLELIEEQEAALRWDFRRYLGLALSEIGASIPFGEAISLVAEDIRETGSHLHANLTGLRFAASQSDIALILHATWFMNANKDDKQHPEQIELPGPFVRPEEEPDATDGEKADALAYLEAHSAFQ